MENGMYDDKQGGAPHLDKVEARAGSRSKVNRNVLIVSLLLVVLVLAAVVGFGFLRSDRTGADEVNAESASAEPNAAR
jgi:hypothetical protein